MSVSADPGHFFQTDASEATRARKAAKAGNKSGRPIPLQSKILGIIADPRDPACVYTAESTGCVRRVNVQTQNKSTVYRGPQAPVTAVAIGGKRADTIFAGCWDKDIWSWDRESRAAGRRFKGHTDFVKALVSCRIGGQECLISGGADSKIMVWDVETGERIHSLRDKNDTMMAIQDLALDPTESTDAEIILVSASSDPHLRRWRISLSAWSQVYGDLGEETMESVGTTAATMTAGKQTILEHETSIYKVIFTGDGEDAEDCDLWTASADGTSKCLSRSNKWRVEETYTHGDYVRAVVVTSDWAVTTGRDEDVKVWDRATGKLWHVYEGHFDEVTDLVLVGGGEDQVVSVSIDGTLRTWPLGKAELGRARQEREDHKNGVVKEEEEKSAKKSLLTAEEEAELAELMDSDEDDDDDDDDDNHYNGCSCSHHA